MNVLFLFLLQVIIILTAYFFQQRSQIEIKKIENAVNLYLNEKVFEKIKHLPFNDFENPEFQNNFNKINMNQNRIIKLSTDGLDFLAMMLSIFSIFGFLLSISWGFISFLVLGIIPVFNIQMKFGRKRYQLTGFLTPYNRRESYIANLLEQHQSQKEIRLFGLENYLVKKWENYYKTTTNKNLDLLKRQSKLLLAAQCISLLTYAASGILALFLISHGRILIGSLVAVLQAIQQIQGTLNGLSNLVSGFYESSLIINDFRSFLKMNEVKNLDSGLEIKKIESIQIKQLSFSYPSFTKTTIKNIDLHIVPGKKIAIIGENGSGKTTLIKCIVGLYETKGAITINGIPLETLNLSSYQNRIAVLFQDFNQYELTALENIGFGDIREINNINKIRVAANLTEMDAYIMGLPKQYDTQLGRYFDGGYQLSGGQWQKIALARCLFRQCDVIFLDEPTAALDPKSEIETLEMLIQKSKSKALVYITHRLGAAQLADEILLMKDGSIIERGSHQELLNLKGEYSKMYELQSKWYITKDNREVMI
nr:ABC transporter ATP-binding protein [Caenibacillus caldisaponilyticus]